MLAFTTHAHRRLQQRGLTPEFAALVMDHGTAVNTAGALFYFMSKKDLPWNIPNTVKERIAGITLVVDPGSHDVLTVYKNQHAMKQIRKKCRYDRYSAHRRRSAQEAE